MVSLLLLHDTSMIRLSLNHWQKRLAGPPDEDGHWAQDSGPKYGEWYPGQPSLPFPHPVLRRFQVLCKHILAFSKELNTETGGEHWTSSVYFRKTATRPDQTSILPYLPAGPSLSLRNRWAHPVVTCSGADKPRSDGRQCRSESCDAWTAIRASGQTQAQQTCHHSIDKCAISARRWCEIY